MSLIHVRLGKGGNINAREDARKSVVTGDTVAQFEELSQPGFDFVSKFFKRRPTSYATDSNQHKGFENAFALVGRGLNLSKSLWPVRVALQ